MVTRIGALALADFRERRRRPGYLVVLLGTLALGLLAAPVGDSRWEVFQVTDLHGRYTSGYVGTVTALGGAVWLSLAGFGIARGAVPRDEQSGVGQLLAATPLGRIAYLAGKFGSNLLLFGSMLLALAGTALGVQLVKGDSGRVDVVRLLLPYVLITLPLLAVVAACAVLFDTLPGLRGGVGAMVWFVVWLVLVLGAQTSGGLDLLGMRRITASIREVLAAGGRPVDGVEFGAGGGGRVGGPAARCRGAPGGGGRPGRGAADPHPGHALRHRHARPPAVPDRLPAALVRDDQPRRRAGLPRCHRWPRPGPGGGRRPRRRPGAGRAHRGRDTPRHPLSRRAGKNPALASGANPPLSADLAGPLTW
ncbi:MULTISPECIES: ABC transporter permease [Streptomyces]|uniref:ABC transporter permease n=1 Tax=Streptomyces TaxID=1883 RepID=UPI000A4A1C9C|nr:MULTISPECIES: hypothetical protein [Streptomyces]